MNVDLEIRTLKAQINHLMGALKNETVKGASSSTDGNVAVFDGHDGKKIKDSGIPYDRIYKQQLTSESNLNNLTDGGMYRLSNVTNGYPGASWSNMFVLRVGDTITQIGFPYNTQDIYFRSSQIGTLASKPWQRVVLADGSVPITGMLQLIRNGVTSSIGSNNPSFLHFVSDAPNGFYFNQKVRVQGEIYGGSGYNKRVYHQGNLQIRHGTISLNTSWQTFTFSSAMAGAPSVVVTPIGAGDLVAKVQNVTASNFQSTLYSGTCKEYYIAVWGG